MSTPQEREQQRELEQHQRDTLHASVGAQVVHILGHPGALQRVQVRPLWGNYYRVNVLFGADAVSCKVAHSYFVTVNGEGKIVESTPKLVAQG